MIGELEIHDASSGSDVFVGALFPTLRRGFLSTTFIYDPSYLAKPSSYALGPSMPMSSTPLHFAGLPGVLRDSLPDRWGRHLIERELRLLHKEDGALRTLDDIDYLVGVFDLTREGSLRVKQHDGPFLSQSANIPPRIDLPALMDAARAASKDSAGLQQIKELLDAGSGSLGGARPKASIREGEKLLLAKFSHPGDEWDVMGWEKTTLELGKRAGIPVPPSQLVRVGKESALLLERFDRENSLLEGRRIPYVSGITLLEVEDDAPRDYAELAEAIADYCENPVRQLEQLFRRVVFYVAVNNTDDHMRNWGFLREGSWGLSPMFDINPNPAAFASRVTSIVGASSGDVASALEELAGYCAVDDVAMRRIAKEVTEAVSDWRIIAGFNGISDAEQDRFVHSFASGLSVLSKLQ